MPGGRDVGNGHHGRTFSRFRSTLQCTPRAHIATDQAGLPMPDPAPNPEPPSARSGLGIYAEMRPHAYDPLTNPELFEGVLARRVVAFVIDLVIIALPILV